MAAFKNKDNGTWYVQFRYTDWKGERHNYSPFLVVSVLVP